ncbi:hypothetical protein TNCV_3329721 [Trichonephila clavipes]|nr:hypothetical protein TNCV_3329721 [Trichonephila clavipes]
MFLMRLLLEKSDDPSKQTLRGFLLSANCVGGPIETQMEGMGCVGHLSVSIQVHPVTRIHIAPEWRSNEAGIRMGYVLIRYFSRHIDDHGIIESQGELFSMDKNCCFVSGIAFDTY